MDGRKDVSLEQAMMVANSFGRLTTLTHHLVFTFVEPSPKQLSKVQNITYALDSCTWVALLAMTLLVSFALYILTHDPAVNAQVQKGRIQR